MINGQRIAQLREVRRLTQGQLVDRIPGLNQSRLSRIEKNLAPADDELVALFAVELGVTVDFLRKPDPELLAAHSPQFRARSRLTQSSKNSVMQWACLSHEALAEVRKRGSRIPVKLPQLIDTDPAEAAREIRVLLGFDLLQPLPYLLLALERIGVTILGLPCCDDAVDAFCAWHGDEPIIAMLDGRPGDRIRYSVAHELGHLVLHGKVGMRTGQSGAGREIETEADAFAAEILIPLGAIARAMPSRPTLNNLAMLKTQWGVSIKSLVRRARELGTVDQERAISLYKQISSRGWNRFEPGHVPVEKPRAFRKIVEIVYGESINMSRFAADRGWSEELAYEVLRQYASPSELPFDTKGPKPKDDVGDNVVQLSSWR